MTAGLRKDSENSRMKQKDTLTNDRASDRLGIVLVIISLLLMIVCVYVIASKTDINIQYTGDKWYETHDMTLPELPDITIPDTSPLSPSAVSENYVYGNLPQLSTAKAAVCRDDEWYYLADPTQGNGLIRAGIKTLSERRLLFPASVRCINVKDDMLYFSTSEDNGDYPAGIYSMRTDGSGIKLMKKGDFLNLQLMNDRLYFVRSYDGCICRLDINGTGDTVIAKEECRQLLLAEGRLFAILSDESGKDGHQSVICSMDPDGDDRDYLTEYGEYDALGYYEGMLLYSVYDEGYGKLYVSRKKSVSFNSAEENFIRIKGLHSVPVMHGNELWYIDSSAGNTLTVFDTENSERHSTGISNVISFFIVDDILSVNCLDDSAHYSAASYGLENGEPVPLYGEIKE